MPTLELNLDGVVFTCLKKHDNSDHITLLGYRNDTPVMYATVDASIIKFKDDSIIPTNSKLLERFQTLTYEQY